jgi:pimeloyl-ACP methyl ester carboxylesterase
MTSHHPHLYFRSPGVPKPEASLFVYLPGGDGTGQLLRSQLSGLERAFDVRCLSIPSNAQLGWEQLAEQVVNLVEAELERQPRRCVFLCGESFGGCLALKVILQSPNLFDRLVLVNPASSFSHNPILYWGSYLLRPVPEPLHQVTCVGLLPFLASLGRIDAANRYDLLSALESMTQEASIWKVSLLREFQISEVDLSRITAPTLIIASKGDRLLPSVAEAQHLVNLLVNAQLHILPDSGHACLLESNVNLYEILKDSHLFNQMQLIEAR